MLNWPGAKVNGPGGASSSVTVSADSRVAVMTRQDSQANQGAGLAGLRSLTFSASTGMTIHIQQLEPGCRQHVRGQRGEPAHELIAQPRVRLALAAQACSVHFQGPDPLNDPAVEL